MKKTKIEIIVMIIQIALVFALTVWLYGSIRQDPANASSLPIVALSMYVTYLIVGKKYQEEKLKKEIRKEMEENMEKIVQKHLDRKEDEKIMQEYENKPSKIDVKTDIII